MSDLESLLKAHIRDVPDFPEPGVLFRDITPLLMQPLVFARAVEGLREVAPPGATHIVAVDARGFLFAAPLALQMNLPLVLARKPNKLPRATVRVEYELEYGANVLALHSDALRAGDVAYIVDDLIATGGTLAAAAALVERCGARTGGIGCVVELTELNGRELLQPSVVSLAKY